MNRNIRASFLILVTLLIAGCRTTWLTGDRSANAGDYVILLHGMGRSHRSMRPMEEYLSEQGYQVLNVDYPTLRMPVDELAASLDKIIERRCTDKNRKVHFVTHSFGGILTRVYLEEARDVNVGRVVMMAPPNSGTEIVDTLKALQVDKKLPVTLANFWTLGTGDDALPKNLNPVNFEVGIIAGKASFNPLYSSLISGEDDGKVSVSSAKTEGMKDFLVLNTSHTFMMRRKPVMEQVQHFLEHGTFKRQEE